MSRIIRTYRQHWPRKKPVLGTTAPIFKGNTSKPLCYLLRRRAAISAIIRNMERDLLSWISALAIMTQNKRVYKRSEDKSQEVLIR